MALLPTTQPSMLGKNIIQIPTPNNLPLLIEVQGVELSPYFQMGPDAQIEFLDFTLENLDEEYLEENSYNSSIDEEDEDAESSDPESSDSQDFSESEENDKNEEEEKFLPDLPTSKLNLRYFKQSLAQMRQKKSSEDEIRRFISEYLTLEDQENINVAEDPLDDLIRQAERNLRPLGPISWLERRAKVLKFRSKKSRRIWNKKINYDCRKKVADSRLRVKGKFVTKEQACTLLGIEEQNEENLKGLLRNYSTS